MSARETHGDNGQVLEHAPKEEMVQDAWLDEWDERQKDPKVMCGFVGTVYYYYYYFIFFQYFSDFKNIFSGCFLFILCLIVFVSLAHTCPKFEHI
jgi:hypothetical protein